MSSIDSTDTSFWTPMSHQHCLTDSSTHLHVSMTQSHSSLLLAICQYFKKQLIPTSDTCSIINNANKINAERLWMAVEYVLWWKRRYRATERIISLPPLLSTDNFWPPVLLVSNFSWCRTWPALLQKHNSQYRNVASGFFQNYSSWQVWTDRRDL